MTIDRIQAMKNLRQSGVSLRKIGTAFGVSGARVKQLLDADACGGRRTNRREPYLNYWGERTQEQLRSIALCMIAESVRMTDDEWRLFCQEIPGGVPAFVHVYRERGRVKWFGPRRWTGEVDYGLSGSSLTKGS